MKLIPQTEHALVLRTDFSNQAIWEIICTEIEKPVGIFRFRANVEFLDDIEYADLDKEQLSRLIPQNYNHSFIVVVDQTAITYPDHPLLVIDLYERSGHEFRAIPSQIQGLKTICLLPTWTLKNSPRRLTKMEFFVDFQ